MTYKCSSRVNAFFCCLLILGSSFILAQNVLAQNFPDKPLTPPTNPITKKGEVIITLARGAKNRYVKEYKNKYNSTPSISQLGGYIANSLGLRQSISLNNNTLIVKGRRVKQAKIAAAKAKKLLARAENNYKMFAMINPDDTFFALNFLWGLNNTGVFGTSGVDIDAQEAWNITEGSSSQIVAVIDTGVLMTHPDLVDNIWRNPNETINGLDDDGNGYVDDVTGWDFYNKDNDPTDDHYHGTHVAGTIAASGYNKRGVIGVAPKVKILPIKMLNNKGEGDSATLLEAIEYVSALKRKGHNVSVINASLGGGERSDTAIEVLKKANKSGVLFVAAAGNSTADNDREPTYPASYQIDNVISVAALDATGQLASFSNFGEKSVHVAAPGDNIWSTVTFNLYFPLGGTSMAAPHVAGVAALVYSRNPNFSPLSVRNKIMNSVKPIAGMEGAIVKPGIISAYNAVR